MFRIRRTPSEPRIELAPLIDVMLFLLTFFIYSVMMMERVDLVPMELRSYSSGKAAEPAPAATISVDLEGRVYLDRIPVALDELRAKLEEARLTAPDLVVYLAFADGAGAVDRSPLLLDIWDRLQPGKFNLNIVGKKQRGKEFLDAPAPAPSPAAESPAVPPIPTPSQTDATAATPAEPAKPTAAP